MTPRKLSHSSNHFNYTRPTESSKYAARLFQRNNPNADVVLIVGNFEHPSNRHLLSSASDVFWTMLEKENPVWKESQECRIVLDETDACQAVFQDFHEFICTNRIDLDLSNVLPIFQLSDKYNVISLINLSQTFMAENLWQACKTGHIVSWFQFFSATENNKMANLCRVSIQWNFYLVSSQDNIEFRKMKLDELLSFIQIDELVIHDEMSLFLSIDQWLCSQEVFLTGEANITLKLNHYVQSLLPHVRFPMMSREQLRELMFNTSLLKNHRSLLEDRVRSALCFHKNMMPSLDRWKGVPNFDLRIFWPRFHLSELTSSLPLQQSDVIRGWEVLRSGNRLREVTTERKRVFARKVGMARLSFYQ